MIERTKKIAKKEERIDKVPNDAAFKLVQNIRDGRPTEPFEVCTSPDRMWTIRCTPKDFQEHWILRNEIKYECYLSNSIIKFHDLDYYL